MAKKSGGSTSLVQFGDWDDEEVNQQKEEREATRGSSIIFKIPVGKTLFRAIPPKKGEKLMKVAYVHYVDVPGVGRVQLNCPRLMAKRPCPVCKMEDKLIATGSEADYRKAKHLKAKRRLFMNMVVRGKEEDGIRVLAFGTMVEEQLIEIREDADDGGNFSHPIKGFDLKISRVGTGAEDTKYKVVKTGGVKPLSDDAAQMNDWIANQPSADRFLKVLSPANIEAKLKGEDIDEEDEEEQRPARGRHASRSVDDEIEDGEVVVDEDEDA